MNYDPLMRRIGMDKPPDRKRCTLCGAERTRSSDGLYGACSLIGCKDPLHDYRKEHPEKQDSR